MNIAVIGPGADPSLPNQASKADVEAAYRVGGLVAAEGWNLFSGGMSGVMEAASRGAAEVGGAVVGILPGFDVGKANPWLTVPIPTGLSEARNFVLIRAVSGVICVGGSWGTMSEVAFGLRIGKPVVQIGGWQILTRDGTTPTPGPVAVDSPDEAVEALKQALA